MAKFTMSNGTEGMLRGQTQGKPDAFQKVDPSMPRRNYATDTEHERMPVGPPQKTYAGSTGFTSQCASLSTEGVLEQAITDRLNQSMAQGIEDGYNARMEEEAGDREVTAAEIDEKADKATCDDDELELLRQRRREQMKAAMEKKQKNQQLGHGCYDEIVEEEFLKTVTSSNLSVVHFYHKMFEKCKIMDMHLSRCSKKFFGTRFVKLDAEKSPFFVEKLRIKTLPCAVVFKDGVAVGRQVGFEGLAGDEFRTEDLAWRIKEAGGIEEDFDPEEDVEW
jgi:thiol-disulfide isomerase/thioredoxin